MYDNIRKRDFKSKERKEVKGFKNRLGAVVSSSVSAMIYLGLYWLLDWYVNKPRRNVEEEDDLVRVYKVETKKKKNRLLINEAESELSLDSIASDHN
jgi:hypothetical protein